MFQKLKYRSINFNYVLFLVLNVVSLLFPSNCYVSDSKASIEWDTNETHKEFTR